MIFAIHAQHRVNRIALLAPAASFVPFHKQFFSRLGLASLIRKESFLNRFFWSWFVNPDNRHIADDFSFNQFSHGIQHYKYKVKPVIPAVIPKAQLQTIKVPSLLLIGEQEVIYNPDKVVKKAKEAIPDRKNGRQS